MFARFLESMRWVRIVVVAAAVIPALVIGIASMRMRAQTPEQRAGGSPASPATGMAGRQADHATQSSIRNALVVEKTVYVESQQYADPTSDFDGSGFADLVEIEPSLSFSYGVVPDRPGVVYVVTHQGAVYLSARSPAGSCFYLYDHPASVTQFATDSSCGSAMSQPYTAHPW